MKKWINLARVGKDIRGDFDGRIAPMLGETPPVAGRDEAQLRRPMPMLIRDGKRHGRW
ncbi:hypothetical protein [Sodalis praecaptivus]|uniref:hypothetical protein n=1 Tax=Sodalis praecaptivus TaxID=1239307 RepID=UPI0031F9C1C1